MMHSWHGHRREDSLSVRHSRGAADWLAGQMKALLTTKTATERIGAYVATDDAGVDVALEFWRSAIADGVDLVNPRDFPWTLPSSVTAQAVQRAGVRGPCVTLIGDNTAQIAALTHGMQDLGVGIVDLALIASVSFSYPQGALVIALGATGQPGIAGIDRAEGQGTIPPDGRSMADPLLQMCLAVERRQSLTIRMRTGPVFHLCCPG